MSSPSSARQADNTGDCAATGWFLATSNRLSYMVLTEVAESWSAAVPPVPAGASPSPAVTVTSVACETAGSCVAVGRYSDSSGNGDALILSGVPGSWTAAAAPLPPDAAPDPNAQLTEVTCPTPSTCIAVGNYDTTSNQSAGLLLVESAGSWTASEAPLPPGASGGVSISALSCASATLCLAGGRYTDSGSDSQGLLLSYAGGSPSGWSAVQAPIPPGAAANPEASITSVSCPTASSCVAVGSYENTSNIPLGLLLSGNGSPMSWSASPAPEPAGVNSSYPEISLQAVACSAPTACTSVGSYYDTSYYEQPLLLSESSNGSWSAARAPLPAGAGSDPDSFLDAVSCPASGSCVAGGSYYDPSWNEHAVLLTESGATWSAAQAPLPPGAAGSAASIDSISCSSAGTCAAAGQYLDGSGNHQGLLLADVQGSWSAASAPLPGATSGDPSVTLPQVACVTGGYCIGAGEYTDPNGGVDPLFEVAYVGMCTASAGGAACAVPLALAVSGGTLALQASPQLYWDVGLDGYDQWESASASALSSCSSSGGGTSCSGGSAPRLEVLDATGSDAGWSLTGYLSTSDLPGGSLLDFDGSGGPIGSSQNDPLSTPPFAAGAPPTTCDLDSTCSEPSLPASCGHAALGVAGCPSYPVDLVPAIGATSQLDLYSASAGSGMGAVCLASGSATATGCAGTAPGAFYDLGVPADAASGSYATTVLTLTISSGP
jgi:hypothetical protein